MNASLIEDLVKYALREHLVVGGDSWFSCPLSGDCSDDAQKSCNCGAEKHNTKVVEIASQLGVNIEPPKPKTREDLRKERLSNLAYKEK